MSGMAHLNIVSPENLLNPQPLYKELREVDPVHWSEPVHAWILTRYDDVMGCFRDPRLTADRTSLFEYQLQGLEPELARSFLQVIRNQMFMLEGREHVRLRRQSSSGFTPQRLDAWRPAIRAIMRGLLEGVADRGKMDVVAEISYVLPPLVIAEMLGVPTQARERFQLWSKDLAGFFSPPAGGDLLEVNRRASLAVAELKRFFTAIIEERRREPGQDALSMMIEAQEHGRMSVDELVANTILILFAGHSTTTDQISNGVHALLTHPEQLQLLRRRPELLRSAVEEIIRFSPAVPFTGRIAVEPFELRGKAIRKGDMLMMCMAAANRDPEHFPEPERFDITRGAHQQKHLSFGFGAHHCMGAGLARSELEIAFEMLLERLPTLRLDEERPLVPKCHGLTFRGFESLPVRW